ncbi:NUDIX domain-containing protein [Succinivibrio sp.]|uniref:NUDIX domain-containing protein n=1 Tax=Succinivibrio sp. TaxID=2053619 RepID=UPI00386FE761
MSATELVDIVDEDNNIVKTVTRKEMRKEQLPHRASYIAVMDHSGKFLIEIRTLCKDYSPGTFDAVVGGVMQHGEDEILSAKRELLEEIGVDADQPSCEFHSFGPYKIISKSGMRFFYGYLYLAITDSITVRQKSEVSGILYLSEEDVLRLADSTAYDSVVAFKEIVKRAKEQGLIK